MNATMKTAIGRLLILVTFLSVVSLVPAPVLAQGTASAAAAAPHAGGEANLVVPDLSTVSFLGGTNGRTLLMSGLLVCALGLLFGLMTFTGLKNLPVHASMLEVS